MVFYETDRGEAVDKYWQVFPSYKKRFVFSEVACDMVSGVSKSD